MEPPIDRELFSTTCWAIWHRRNKVRLKQQVEKADHIPLCSGISYKSFNHAKLSIFPAPSSPATNTLEEANYMQL
jgi:hypothetical protein